MSELRWDIYLESGNQTKKDGACSNRNPETLYVSFLMAYGRSILFLGHLLCTLLQKEKRKKKRRLIGCLMDLTRECIKANDLLNYKRMAWWAPQVLILDLIMKLLEDIVDGRTDSWLVYGRMPRLRLC